MKQDLEIDVAGLQNAFDFVNTDLDKKNVGI